MDVVSISSNIITWTESADFLDWPSQEKVFCLEPKIKEENSDDDNEDLQTIVSVNSDSKVQSGDDTEPVNDSKDNIHGRNVKKKVGRPKKPIEEKVVKAPGMCQICGGLYVGLKYHMYVHEVPKFECDYCGKRWQILQRRCSSR